MNRVVRLPSDLPGAVPENVEAEAALLGALLIDNSLLNVLPTIRPSDFFEPVHGRIFERILSERQRLRAVNAHTLRPFFENDEALQELGGVIYLARLQGDGQGLLAPRELAQQIIDLASLRELNRIGRSLAAAALDTSESTDPAEITAKVQNDLARLAQSTATASALPFIDFTSWQGDPPNREWLWHNLLPIRQTTLLTGAGGVGKSLAAQQLATCIALGRPFLGRETQQRAALYVTAEDDADELWRRQAAICEALDVPLASLAGRLCLVSLAGDPDTALAIFDAENRMTATDRWRQVAEAVSAHGIGFIAADNATDLMAGDHNDVHQVAAFVNLLTGLAIETNGSVLILHHPNKAGEDWLGSVAWHNKVRSRLILQRSVGADPDARNLENPKANYGPSGDRIEFRWHQGAFVRDEDLPEDTASQLRSIAVANAENAAFMRCLDERNKQERPVSENPASARTFAPKVFADMAEAKGITRAGLEAALDRLFRTGEIEVGLVCRTGRKDRYGLRRKCADPRADPALTGCADPALTPRQSAPTHTLPLTGGEGAALKAAAPSHNPD